MKRFVIAFCLAFFPAVAVADMIRVNPTITLDGETVMLSQLFEGVAPEKDRIIGRSPSPGRRHIMSPLDVEGLARKYGVDWRADARSLPVVMVRSFQTVSTDTIRAALRGGVENRMPRNGDYDLMLDNAALQIVLPTTVAPEVTVRDVTVNPQSLRFSGLAIAAAGTPYETVQPVSGRMVEVMEVPVLRVTKNRGDRIGANDVEWISLPVTALSRDSLLDEGDLVGFEARRTLVRGQPVASRDVVVPLAVKRNEAVSIVLETPTLYLSARGRALESGAKGDVINVLNVASRRTVEVQIIGPGEVAAITGGNTLMQ